MKRIIIVLTLVIFSCAQVDSLTQSDLKAFEKVIGLNLTDQERALFINDLQQMRQSFKEIRDLHLKNSIPYVLGFNPILPGQKISVSNKKSVWKDVKTELPDNINDIAYFSIPQLAYLLRTKQLSSEKLTQFYIARLKKFNPKLEAVITVTEERAIKSAKKADAEIVLGKYKGLLHGVPFGVKDLLSVEGYKTTWGAEPYKDQVLNETATVVKKLEEAGAILVAKLTLGALAWGDVWYGGKTKNPWNLEQGSSGSSAGSASATAAGLVPFAIGTETWGSIVSPSLRCGVTGLRPTFGRVSKHGAMALSWSMDKIGPIARSVEDCAIVFDVIRGTDHLDMTVQDFGYYFNPSLDIKHLKIGYFKDAFESEDDDAEAFKKVLTILEEMGVTLIPVKAPTFNSSMLSFILSAESAAAFDELTLSNKDDLMKRQIKNAWPNSFRQARYITAVEYIQANRARALLMKEMNDMMANIDLLITPAFANSISLTTNLTGHPTLFIPVGFNAKKSVAGISLIGGLFDEGTITSFGVQIQKKLTFKNLKPPGFE